MPLIFTLIQWNKYDSSDGEMVSLAKPLEFPIDLIKQKFLS